MSQSQQPRKTMFQNGRRTVKSSGIGFKTSRLLMTGQNAQGAAENSKNRLLVATFPSVFNEPLSIEKND